MRPEEESEEQSEITAFPAVAPELLSCMSTSVQTLKSLMEFEDFSELSDVFLSICRRSSSFHCSFKPDTACASASHMRVLHLGNTRPSSASTAAPSSSLSLSSASMDLSAAVDQQQNDKRPPITPACTPQHTPHCNRNTSHYSHSTHAVEANSDESKNGGHREQENSSCCAAAAAEAATAADQASCRGAANNDEASSPRSTATPTKRSGGPSSPSVSRSRNRLKVNSFKTQGVSLTRRSPRLNQTSHGRKPTSTSQHAPHTIEDTTEAATAADASSSSSSSSSAHQQSVRTNGSRRGVAASGGRKRRKEEETGDMTPSSTRKAPPKKHTMQLKPAAAGAAAAAATDNQSARLSPLKTANTKRKGNRGGATERNNSTRKNNDEGVRSTVR